MTGGAESRAEHDREHPPVSSLTYAVRRSSTGIALVQATGDLDSRTSSQLYSIVAGELLTGPAAPLRCSSFGGELFTEFGAAFGRSSVVVKVVTDRSSSVRVSAGRPSRAGPAVYVSQIRRAGIEPATPPRRVTSRSARPRACR